MEIGATIRQYRLEAGVTQAVLAQKLGVSLTTVKNWERGATIPNNVHIRKVAEALNINPAKLLNNAFSPDTDTPGDNANGFVKASYFAQQLVGLFAGEDLTPEDKEAVMAILTRAYLRNAKGTKITTETNKRGDSIWKV